ncbi:MAG: glycerol kinase GlpK [Myxococcota bacterium]|nr:glycerol kinase GlpK [Myxococcota bacterium]
MARDLVLAIDQGTTGSTALLLSQDMRVLATHNVEFPNHYPQPGYVEHDVEEIWESVGAAVQGALAKAEISPERIAAIGITNQRETSLFWDRATGTAYHRALVWQDRRTADRCKQLKEAGHEPLFRERTGLVLDPYFSGTKAAWLLDQVPGLRSAAASGKAAFGTIDSWLTHRLTGVHVTDPSNASRTLLMRLDTLQWDPELLAILGIPQACLPEIRDSSEIYGSTKGVPFLPDGIPVAGLIGDQQGALFGQACFSPGMAKCTYGTGAFVLMNTGDTPTQSSAGMLTTVAWRVGGKPQYAIEGSAFIAGAAVQWLRDGLGIISTASEIEALARSVPNSGGVVFVPALSGLGAPHWRPEARGAITGITGGTTKAHLARAALEGVALQIADILRAMSQDLGAPLAELRMDGGAARNDLLMQLQADLLRTRCVRPQQLETTALGSAFLAGLAVGLWKDQQDLARSWRKDRDFTPTMTAQKRDALLESWRVAVEKA